MKSTLQNELDYKVQVEPNLFAVLDHIAADCANFGFTEEHVTRAVWNWADQRIQGEQPPQWLWTELARREQASDAANTIEGEAGDE